MFEYDRGDSPIAIVPQISSPKLQVPLPIDIPSTRGDTSLLLSSKLWAKSGLRSRSANIPHPFREAGGIDARRVARFRTLALLAKYAR